MRLTETLGWIAVGAVFATLVIASINAGEPYQLAQCPKSKDGEKLAYATYEKGTIKCTYIPNIYGIAGRTV